MKVDDVHLLMEQDNYIMANVLCRDLRNWYPNDTDLKELQRQIHDKITVDTMPGPKYLEWITHLHELLEPKTYLEIGVETGQSLQYIKAPTTAIGIDPEPKIIYELSDTAQVFPMTSDEFFANHDPEEILGGKIEFSFIDGLHYYDQVLRDFINVEKYCNHNSVILFHDVAPAVGETATREWTTTYWAGDTWKFMNIVAKYRPDLTVVTIPSYPTGLGLITNFFIVMIRFHP